jgi:acyl-CoA synthetase (NDP forming)
MRALAARADVATAAPAGDVPPVGAVELASNGQLLESDALAALAAAGVPTAATELCRTPEEAESAARRLGSRIVVKAAASDLLHKSDAGAVLLDVADARSAHEHVVAAALAVGSNPAGSLVQARAADGVELIVGVRRSEEFGPILVVGRGGVTAELDDDVSRRLLPLRAGAAAEMLRELRCFPLLDGFRGRPPADVTAAADAIESVAAFAIALGDRLEAVEVNPLLVHPAGEGATAVDALVLLSQEPAHADRLSYVRTSPPGRSTP